MCVTGIMEKLWSMIGCTLIETVGITKCMYVMMLYPAKSNVAINAVTASTVPVMGMFEQCCIPAKKTFNLIGSKNTMFFLWL